MKGRIIKNIADRYTVLVDGEKCISYLSGKLKHKEEVYVDDYVDIRQGHKNFYYIEKLYSRNNLIKRPPIANIDVLLIFVSCVPEPDYILLDKLLVIANQSDVEPIICVSKVDLSDKEYDYVLNNYSKVCKIYSVNSLNKEFNGLDREIIGKTVALAGQSATGKSSFIHALTGINIKIGELSNVDRGKNTTRHTEIYFGNGYEIVDTCGFSSLIVDLPHYELYNYYYDYIDYQSKCKFKTCTHTDEPDCAVKQALLQGELSNDRYKRYNKIFLELKDIFDNKF